MLQKIFQIILQMRISLTILVICFLFSPQILKSQRIVCDLNVVISNQKDSLYEINDKKVDYIFFGIYPIEITQTLYLSTDIKDSLVLQLNHLSRYNQVLSSMFYHNIKVSYLENKQLLPLRFYFNGEKIVISKIPKTKKIIIKYEYQSDFPIKNTGINTIFFMQPQINEWHSWFFTCDNMKVDKINYVVPDNQAYFFSTNMTKLSNNNYYTETKSVINNEISFYLLRKSYYDKVSFKKGVVTTNLFFNKGVHIDTFMTVINDTLRKFGRIQPQNAIADIEKQKIENYIGNALQKITSFFNYKNTLLINIADANLYFEDENGVKHTWGKGMECSDTCFFLAIDTSFWNTNSLMHEMIHAFNKYLPSRNDSSFYFFNESMVEYLSVCFKYEDLQLRDSVFDDKMKYFNSLDTTLLFEKQSIWNVKSNETIIEKNIGGTSPIIYEKTPYLIHSFAKSIGENKFLSILKSFYLNVQAKKKIEFSDFEKSFKKNRVTNKQWSEFIKEL